MDKNNKNILIDKIQIKLFLCILISALPVIIANFNQTSNNPQPLFLVVIAYIIQLSILVFSIWKYKNLFINKNIIIILLYTLILLFTQFSLLFLYNFNSYYDFIDVIVKSINLLVLFFIPLNIKITKKMFFFFMKLLIIFALVACLYNIIFNIKDLSNILNVDSSYSLNFKSFFSNRNQFALFLSISIMASTFMLKDVKNKKIIYIIMFILFCNLLLTFSRTSLLAVLIFMFFIVFLNHKKIFYISAILLTLLFTSSFLILKNENPEFLKQIDTLLLRSDTLSNASGRTEIWKTGIGIGMKNPLSGVGTFNAVAIINEQGIRHTQFHNLYIESLIAGGLIELLLIFSILYIIINRIKKSKMPQNFKNIFYSYYILFIVISSFESTSLFSLGYTDTIFTICFVTIPLMFANNYYKLNDQFDEIESRLENEAK